MSARREMVKDTAVGRPYGDAIRIFDRVGRLETGKSVTSWSGDSALGTVRRLLTFFLTEHLNPSFWHKSADSGRRWLHDDTAFCGPYEETIRVVERVTFSFERFKRFAFERSRITVPSWHGFALSE
jgi:hypothetical protein